MINPECISKITINLATSKATQQGDIPTKIIKDNKEPFSYFISASFNNAVNKGVLPDELKHADIKPIYKKESRNDTPYCTGLEIWHVLIKLENTAETLLQWFKDNRMKANPDKYRLLINNTKGSFRIKIGNEAVSNSKYEKLLGVKIDHEFNFNEHVVSLCKKASEKLTALSRIASCMTFDQRRSILNSFITSHFSYCPIV